MCRRLSHGGVADRAPPHFLAHQLDTPVGGFDAPNILPWQKAGAAGFGIGSAIYRPGDSPETVAAKAHGLVSALA